MDNNKLFEVLLDVTPFSAYAVDIDTNELVYVNKKMNETMYAPEETSCWKKIFGQEEICSWCTIPELKRDRELGENKKLINSFFDEATDRWIQSYDELVVLPDNRTVRYSISVDITEQKEIQANMIKTHAKLAIQSKKLREAKKEIEHIHKLTRESIEYAALIQGALLPEKNLLNNYFKDSFVYWEPKDTVGGDIWQFDELRHEDECLLMFIDCTGHGVPGAFVTMIVKAIEREVVSKIKEDKDMVVSPAWILSYFNKTMKTLLKQETKDAKSNAGFDGGIIYYNRKDQVLKFAGAETALFYIDNDSKLNTIKGNRYSVGYKKCDINYEYKEHSIEVSEGMKFYCTTDGYLDQNGGEKDFPFGKKRFSNIIKENHKKGMLEQKKAFVESMRSYETMVVDPERNDDMTLIGFEIKEESLRTDVILEYDGVLTQGIISHTIDIIENSVENIGLMSKIVTISVELTQNMMHYSKSYDLVCRDIRPAGYIKVTKDKDDRYL